MNWLEALMPIFIVLIAFLVASILIIHHKAQKKREDNLAKAFEHYKEMERNRQG